MYKDEPSKSKAEHSDDNKPEPPNSGTMIVDATCAPSQIEFPQDTELLNEARKFTEKVIDELHIPSTGKKPRTYRDEADRVFGEFLC